MSPMTQFWLAMLATPVLIFTVTTLGKVCRWWWTAVVAKDSDVYGGRYDWLVLLATPIAILWLPATIGLFEDTAAWAGYWTGAPIYAALSFFGPLTFVAAFLRLLGFGKTRLGKLLGFLPPTDEKSVTWREPG